MGGRDGELVQFNLDGQKGSIMGDTNRHGKVAGATVLTMRCFGLRTLLKRSNVKVVDFLSLDIEGHELRTLQGVDWDNVRINVIVAEVTGKTIGAIEAFLEVQGYVRHTPDFDDRSKRTRLLGEDAIFIRDDVVWGQPE